MATTIETIHEDIVNLRKDVQVIKDMLAEGFELSDYAKKVLKEARETSEGEYVDL